MHHLFLSYSRADNESGWVTAFYERLTEQHRRYSARGLDSRRIEIFRLPRLRPLLQ